MLNGYNKIYIRVFFFGFTEENIAGVHDLIVHDYGPGRIIASAHAEVPCSIDVIRLHDMIDNVEKRISKKLNIMMCSRSDCLVLLPSYLHCLLFYKACC